MIEVGQSWIVPSLLYLRLVLLPHSMRANQVRNSGTEIRNRNQMHKLFGPNFDKVIEENLFRREVVLQLRAGAVNMAKVPTSMLFLQPV